MDNVAIQQSQQDLSKVWAAHALATRYDTLPHAALDAAKKSVLDTLGVMLGATSTTPALRGLVDAMVAMGGKPESTVLGFGHKVPAMHAAFLNGAMAHCMDFDDHLPEGHHPSSAVVPAAFAFAERVARVTPVDGRAFLAAIAAGQDIFTRMRRFVEWKQDWMMSPVIGVIAGAAACGKLAGLTVDQLAHALGIATCQAGGTMELAYGVGGNMRGLYSSFPSQGAVLSVIMAQSGVTSVDSSFEGKAGFFQTYFDGRWDRAKMLEKLGAYYLGAEIAYKPWPSCGISHVYIDSVLQMMREHTLSAGHIKRITVHVGDVSQLMCTPIEQRRAPTTTADAKFSIPFCVAVAAVRGNVGIGAFTADGLRDRDVLAFAQKVDAVIDAKYNWASALPTGRVDIETTDGRQLSKLADGALGDINHPLSWDDITGKFRDCAAFSIQPISAQNIENVITRVRYLEREPDVAGILAALTST